MTDVDVQSVPLSRSQQNIYHGVLQDGEPALYLIGRSYRFHRMQLGPFLAALEAAILETPVQLCVLVASREEFGYPELVPRLQVSDIVRIMPPDEDRNVGGVDGIEDTWVSGILAKPLVRYTILTDDSGQVHGLDVHCHHILLDGGATGIVEAALGRHLASGGTEKHCVSVGLAKLSEAHRKEASRVAEALDRLSSVVQRELADESYRSGHGQWPDTATGSAAKGVLQESIQISGRTYDAILTLAEREQIPVNVLIAAAATAVDSSLRQSTQGLLIHAVDNRFGDVALDVATCLVNSVAQPVRFSAFGSVEEVVRAIDRGYVKAARRRWLREEHYRRMYLAINRTTRVACLTLNFLADPCARELRPYLTEPPVTTDIGPIESMTVAGVLNEQQHTLTLAIWNRSDQREWDRYRGFAGRIARALEAMPSMWQSPIAATVGEWFGLDRNGALRTGDQPVEAESASIPAWFADPAANLEHYREARAHVEPWVLWLIQNGVAPGDLVVLTDDGTDKTVDLLIACHLAGCGYSVCDTDDQLDERAHAIADSATHIVDVAGTRLIANMDTRLRETVDRRLEEALRDPYLAAKTAYVMPTSGSTGTPKLVRVTHGSLAVFCRAVRAAYGWRVTDTILQCAPLTSDISVEEIFGAASSGARLARSGAMRAGDLQALAHHVVALQATVADLPTAVWHLLCDDPRSMEIVCRSRLRQIVIGGEAVRPGSVDTWVESGAAQGISLISTYGPTETTVVVTWLSLIDRGTAARRAARSRLGRPLVPNTVFVAFGEVIIVGAMVAEGYLGADSPNFGTVTIAGSRRRAFATADRITVDSAGFPVLAGRKDAIVKISGKRVDTAAIARLIVEDPRVADAAVELSNGGLGVWYETLQTRQGLDDAAAAARIRRILNDSRVSSFVVVGMPRIPRKPNGKVDSERLRAAKELDLAGVSSSGIDKRAAGLAAVWSRCLGRAIQPESSLLDEGIGSLDLISVLPETRRYLGRPISILELIAADTAGSLVDEKPTGESWMDVDTANAIERDAAALVEKRPHSIDTKTSAVRKGDSILVLGASGVLGTGFAQAILDIKQSAKPCPDVVFAVRSSLPERGPWTALHTLDGVRLATLTPESGPSELADLIRDAGAGTVVNCVGDTRVTVPYHELRPANVDVVSAVVQACAEYGAGLVHLSTYVVDADVTAARVTDPREAPYPYAASKALAELAVAGSPDHVDFTIVRLPRILGSECQMPGSGDILVAIADACVALGAHPAVTLTEHVTTGRAAAESLLHHIPGVRGATRLGRGITVVRGEGLAYKEFLSRFGAEELGVTEWKQRLDESDWARRNPRRWSVIDSWITLGARLGSQSYAEYLDAFATIDLATDGVTELATTPRSLYDLVAHGLSGGQAP